MDYYEDGSLNGIADINNQLMLRLPEPEPEPTTSMFNSNIVWMLVLREYDDDDDLEEMFSAFHKVTTSRRIKWEHQ